MTSGPDGDDDLDDDRVDLSKDDAAEPPFDPYRFGKPDYPVPPEYAPPGYVPDEPAPAPGNYPYPPAASGPAQPPYGQPPYGQQPYGQSPYPPPPPGYGPPPPGYGPGYGPGSARRGNGKAVTALVCGIASIVLCWLTFLALLVIIPAVVFGILGLNDAKARGGTGRNMAVAGIACAVVGAILATTLTIFAVRAVEKCGGTANSGDPGFQQCVQDHLVS